MNTYTLNLESAIDLTDDQFYQLCRNNPDLKFERTAQGELLIMPPTGGETGRHNSNLIIDVGIWNRKTQLGQVFDSSTCFKLPNGADRSPDVSWIQQTRWDTLTPEQKEKFPPICPDFVIELMSPSDTLKAIRAKMQEYIDNGAKLGWLLNRKDQQVEIHRIGQEIETLQSPTSLSGEAILPGFILDLSSIWQ
ncbi:MAG: Uma2 family endonuclease [Phormidesmis sp. CAN_BIN44]|nr:Uma2 family endonuclease [Phormidesmis sp. CAN_BIN44]